MGLLEKYQGANWFDENFANFEGSLEKGVVPHIRIPGYLLVRTYCTACDEDCTAIRYHGRRYLLVASGTEQMGRFWVIHQCPHPFDIGVEEGHPEPTEEEEIDWHERQDIEEELKKNQWADDPYNHPDIPYVPPGEWK